MVCVYCKYLHYGACTSTYLCSGSSHLRTHWDSRSKHWKMNDGMLLCSDRLDYSLQSYIYDKDVYGSTASMRACINV